MTAPFAAATVPLVDIAGLRSANLSDRLAVAREIGAACASSGFLYIRNHGIEARTIGAMLAQAIGFFAQPEPRKRAVSIDHSPCHRGYEPLRSQTLEAGTAPDLNESFYLANDLPPDHPAVLAGRFNHGPNQWPEGLPDFKAVSIAYFDALYELSGRLMGALALSLDLPEAHFAPLLHDAAATLRLLHYPPQPRVAAAGEIGSGAHTDFGALTILLQDDVGGLQVRPADTGTWTEAPPIAGTFVVNIGDLIERWTNGRYRSTLHRVINRSGRERYAVPYFFTGNHDTLVECIPTCLAPGATPLYPPVTVDQHMTACYRRAYT